jgi:hypothetical protein
MAISSVPCAHAMNANHYDQFTRSLKTAKVRREMRNPVDWLNEQAGLAHQRCSIPSDHPGIRFSSVLGGLIDAFTSGDEESLSILVS